MKFSALRPVSRILARELGMTALLLFGVSLVVFFILYLAPGDPFASLLAESSSSPEGGAPLRRGWLFLYLQWLGHLLQGDLGTSLRSGLPVLGEVVRVGINTLYLTIGSLLVTLLAAVPIALWSARQGTTRLNWPLTMLAYVVSALPVFWFGYAVIYVFIHQFGLFPILFGGSGDQRLGWLYFLVPILVLGIGNGTISEVIRYLREEMSRVLAEDYVRTARAKGAPVWKHAFKEGFLIPVTEIVAAKIPFILGGAVVVEQVFNWPGMGRMAWQAAQDRDYPVIMGIALAAALIVRLGSLFQKVVYVSVNPRASRAG